MTLVEGALVLFDSHFMVDQDSWQNVEALFTNSFDSATKQEEVSDDLAALKIEDYMLDDCSNKDAIKRLIYCIATSVPLALPSNRNDTLQKKFLKLAVNGTEWGLHT